MRNSNISWLRGSFVWREVLFKSGHYLTYLTGKWAREPLFSPFALSGANLHSISFRPEVRQLSNWPPATEAFQPSFHFFTKIHEREKNWRLLFQLLFFDTDKLGANECANVSVIRRANTLSCWKLKFTLLFVRQWFSRRGRSLSAAGIIGSGSSSRISRIGQWNSNTLIWRVCISSERLYFILRSTG